MCIVLKQASQGAINKEAWLSKSSVFRSSAPRSRKTDAFEAKQETNASTNTWRSCFFGHDGLLLANVKIIPSPRVTSTLHDVSWQQPFAARPFPPDWVGSFIRGGIPVFSVQDRRHYCKLIIDTASINIRSSPGYCRYKDSLTKCGYNRVASHYCDI